MDSTNRVDPFLSALWYVDWREKGEAMKKFLIWFFTKRIVCFFTGHLDEEVDSCGVGSWDVCARCERQAELLYGDPV
jgi:hypothetical protein